MEGCTSSIFELVQGIAEMYMWFQFEEASSIREKVIAITRKCTTVMYIYVPYIMEGCTSSIFELVQGIDEMYTWFQFEEASSIREKLSR
jgi:hypothetical protein